MNSMCSIGYCLNAIILTIDLDYSAMTALCHDPTQADETLYTELLLKSKDMYYSCCTFLTYGIILVLVAVYDNSTYNKELID